MRGILAFWLLVLVVVLALTFGTPGSIGLWLVGVLAMALFAAHPLAELSRRGDEWDDLAEHDRRRGR